MTTYRVITVSNGAPIAELVRAQVVSITHELNHWGDAVYRIASLDYQAAEAATLLSNEVQIWRDGKLYFWGIPVAYRAGLDSIEITAHGLLYYFARRHFGPVYSNTMPKLLANGDFEHSTVATGWTSSSPAPTIAASTLHHYVGKQSIKLTGGGATPSPANLYYIYQFVSIPSPSRTKPLTVTPSAWCYPENVDI